MDRARQKCEIGFRSFAEVSFRRELKTRARDLSADYMEIPALVLNILGMTAILLHLADLLHGCDQARRVFSDEFRKFRRVEVSHRAACGLEGFRHLWAFTACAIASRSRVMIGAGSALCANNPAQM